MEKIKEEKSCMSCLYLVTHEKCDGCLSSEADYAQVRENMKLRHEQHSRGLYGQEPEDPPFRYLNYLKGNGPLRGYDWECNGIRNVVIGFLGEAEVNVKWSPEETFKSLVRVAEQCGYLIIKDIWGPFVKVILCYLPHGSFKVFYSNDKLDRIEKVYSRTIWKKK